MRNTIFVAMLATAFFAASAQAAPVRKSVALDDANVGKYVGRVRMTKGAWDYLKITLRDTFKVWGSKNSVGANLLLDPGYQITSPPTAGLARTTPLVFQFGVMEFTARNLRAGNCGACDGVATNYNCGNTCEKTGQWWPNWCQVRRPGFNQGDYPYIYSDMYGTGMGSPTYFHEFGFYIAPEQSTGGGLCPTATVYYDYKNIQVCTTRYNYDTGGGNAGPCTGSAADVLGIATVDYNARIHIYPNFMQEYATSPDGWVPPVRRGPYSGMGGLTAYAARTMTACAGNPTCSDAGDCTSCAAWICWKTGDKWRIGNPACTAQYTDYVYNFFRALPTAIGSHDPSTAYDPVNGSYFRQGDDTAFYLNINQMQIQSVDRASAFVRDCELEQFYTGTMSGSAPYYLTDNQQVANCMRPKMYYDLTNAKWKQCDPFDTWNTDGTLNTANDDDKWMYPGHPASGGFSSPGRCGKQACSGANCFVNTATGQYCHGETDSPVVTGCAGRTASTTLTANSDELFNPGGGWYLMRLSSYTLNAGTNRIDIALTSPDLRVEAGAVVDAHACAVWICYDANEKRFLGRLRADTVNINASIFLYSIDDTSCNPTYPNSCTGNWQRMQNNKNDPDKVVADIQITTLDIVPPGSGNWLDTYMCDDLFLGITLCDILNLSFVKDMLITELENAVKDMVGPALAGIVSALPQLNDAFGDPLPLGTVLLDGGFYLAGDISQAEYPFSGDTYTKRWPIYIKSGAVAGHNVVDLRAAVGFKPIAFRPMSAANWNKNLMEIDTNDPPLADSVYGIPKLYNPDTSGCGSLTSNYCDTAPNPDVEVHKGCSALHTKYIDGDQYYDTEDYCQGTQGYTTSASYINQKTGATTTVGDAALIPEHWEGPIAADKQPPSWCMSVTGINMPRTLRTGGQPADFATLYPQTTWLSFDSTYDTNPAGAAVAKNTVGGWDQMPGNSVLLQNSNTGALDPNPITYDFSAHLHQRFFNEFFQALIASGVTCIEFAAQDTMGADTIFKPLLAADRFSAFLPEISSLFPGYYAKVRFSPMKNPHIRTGLGSITFTPKERTTDPVGGPLPISGQPYTLALAFPDIRIEFLVQNPKTKVETSLMTTYWSPVAGVYAKAVRQCYKLDPLKTDPQCTSSFTNVRTVSGYYEIFADLNSTSLKTAFENVKDGFAAGTFTSDNIGITRGTAPFVIESTYCDTHLTRCKKLGLTQTIPTFLNSLIQMFMVTRLSFYNLTIDFLYVGPDGPNDDGVGQGDYLGIYARLLGNLNVFGLMNNIALLAPGDVKPSAMISGVQPDQWFQVNNPEVDVALRSAGLSIPSDLSYTYRVDQGFWHTPSNDKKLKLDPLIEGEHTLEVRPFEDTKLGARTNMVPTVLKFRVDTVPPDVDILPSATAFYGSKVKVKASDVFTPDEGLVRAYKWDDAQDWEEFDGDTISARGLSDGKHTLRVRVTDYAGNNGFMAREIAIKDAGWGCGGGFGCAIDNTGRLDVSVLLVLLAIMRLGWARMRRSR